MSQQLTGRRNLQKFLCICTDIPEVEISPGSEGLMNILLQLLWKHFLDARSVPMQCCAPVYQASALGDSGGEVASPCSCSLREQPAAAQSPCWFSFAVVPGSHWFCQAQPEATHWLQLLECRRVLLSEMQIPQSSQSLAQCLFLEPRGAKPVWQWGFSPA